MLRAASVLLWAFAALLAATGIPEAAKVSQNIAITITPATQSVGFDPAGFTFASRATGTASPEQALTLTNTGTVSLPLANVTITGADAGDFFQTNNCPNPLAVSGSCQISVIFVPMGTSTRTASVVATASGGRTYAASLSGTGAPGTTLMPAFYVAPNGSDSNPGTLAAPFATLGKCQAAMQANGTIKACYLRAGTYTLPPSGLVLTGPADNGETWSYYPPDGVNTPILSGASLSPNTFSINTSAINVTFTGLAFMGNNYIVVFSQGDNTNWINNLIDGGGTNPWYGLDIYGNNLLVAGNTIQGLSGSGAYGIEFNGTGVTNSVIKNNTIQCLSHYGMQILANSTGNIIAGNQVLGIGHVGGAPPGCGPQVDPSGTGIDVENTQGNLFVNNTIQGVEGYAIVISNGGGGSFINNNVLQSNSDPIITLNGGPGTVITHNTVTSPGSVGFNLGDEHDACPRSATSNNLLVTNNHFNTAYEPIYLSATQNSVIQGNAGNIGTQTAGNPSPHWPAGISVVNWAADAGCAVVENSTNNIIQLNSFSSNAAAAQYGSYFESNQSGNTLAYNVLYPFGSPGGAAVQNNSGGAETLTNNQTTPSTSPLNNAPPVADAGPGVVVGPGQNVLLDGSATRLMTGGTAGVSYAWTQISGPPVTIANAGSVQASFTAPAVSQATILGFRLTATNAGGSAYDQVYYGVDPSI